MTLYIVTVTILMVLLAVPWIVWYMSSYEKEFRQRRKMRENLRRSRETK